MRPLAKFAGIQVAMFLVFLTGCAVLGVPQPQTFNQKMAAAIHSVTVIRETTNVLAENGKITPKDAQNIQNSASQARDGLNVALELYGALPQAGEDRLAASIRILESLQRYVDQRAKE